MSSSASERVKVIVRSRPLSKKETKDGHESVVLVHLDRREIEVQKINQISPKSSSSNHYYQGTTTGGGGGDDTKVFAFDAVYDQRITQTDLYQEAFRPLVASVLEGFNGTIFAYGQTGTGKTYTMEGIRNNEAEQGVIPNSFRHIFQHVAENSAKQYLIRASYLEIYQEEIRDLLSKDKKQMRELRESPSAGVYVKDLSTFLCSNIGDIRDIMTRGNKNRSVGATNMNEHSSRSHAIFQITIEMSEKWADGRNHFKVGKLNLVDLAGSERQDKTGAGGERLREATKINLSLSALGNVIAALVDSKTSHIPYRDSKLTRLLQDSLGGNSRTIMVATIGPASFNLEETITTLRYASRAKKIKNKPKVNEDPKDALLRQYQEEIERLRAELERKKQRQRNPRQQQPNSSATSVVSIPFSRTSHNVRRQLEEKRLGELTVLLEPYGLDPNSDPKIIMEKLEKRRKELMRDKLTMKADKDILLKKLDETESLVRNTEVECSKLSERIGWLESKVLSGGKDLVDHTNAQQKLLQSKQQELEEQMERYDEMKNRLKEELMTIEDLKISIDCLEMEGYSRIKKYRKLFNKCAYMKEQISMNHVGHNKDMRELETLMIELKKEFHLKRLIIDNFVPRSSRRVTERRVRWDPNSEKYYLVPLDSSNGMKRPPRRKYWRDLPAPKVIELAPICKPAVIRNVYYLTENILQLRPELPKRRATRYIPPSTDPYIASLVRRAIEDVEREIIIDCRKPKKWYTKYYQNYQ